MACDPCRQEGFLNEPDIGTCSLSSCAKQICGPPPHRPDGKVHGERCSCVNGCGLLFCRSHARGHTHGKAPGSTNCFPNLGLTLSGPVLVSAMTALGGPPFRLQNVPGQKPEEELVLVDVETSAEVGDFLMYITPGLEALVLAGITSPGRPPLWALEVVPGQLHEPPRLRPTQLFFTKARVERLAGLAATVFGHAWGTLREREENITAYAPTRSAIEAWDDLTRWARTGAAKAALPVASNWLTHMASRWPPRPLFYTRGPETGQVVLPAAPLEEQERAVWLIGGGGTELEGAPRREFTTA